MRQVGPGRSPRGGRGRAGRVAVINQERLRLYIEANILRGVAGQYARRFADVERDDVEQELRLWLWLHEEKVTSWFAAEVVGDPFRADKLTARAMQNAAHDYCMTQVAQIATVPLDRIGARRARTNAASMAAVERQYE